MEDRVFTKNFNNFKGRDVRSSDLIRDRNYAIEFENARVVKEDSCVNRQGAKIIGNSAQYEGLYTYRYSDTTTGATLEELVSLSDNVFKQIENSITVAYAGSVAPAYISIRLNTTTETFYCTIIEAGFTIVSMDLGTGLEASPITLANLKTTIDATAEFSATIVGSTSFPAAFLPITLFADLSASPRSQVLSVTAYTQMNTLIDDLLLDYHDNRGIDSWELASCVDMSNCLFIATGFNYLLKYDGQNVYRAGLPAAPALPTTALSATGFTDTSIKYIYLYKQIDNRGNIIFGVESDPSVAISPANQKVAVTCTSIQPAEGFNTGCAKVNGNQSTVSTITVDSGHTLKIGDTAYLYDGVSAAFVEREVTAVAATTVTIAGATVTVLDNASLSNNLRIVIYRTTASGNLYYKVAEVPNDSLSVTTTYSDLIAIASLGSQYVAPVLERDTLDIFPRYLCSHQELLIASGAASTPNTWYYSSSEGVEYFPAESNYEDIRATGGGGIRGLGSDQEHLAIGTDRSLFVVTGDLYSDTVRQERLADRTVGFACHNSIVQIGDRIIFLSLTGFYALSGGFSLQEIGEPINTEFNLYGVPTSETPRLKRACAVYLEETEEYLCFVPCESGANTSKYANPTSAVHCLDTFNGGWSKWTGLNMGGGVTIYEDALYFQSRRDDAAITVTGNLWKRSTFGSADDYADHHQAIRFRFGTQWMDAGEPSVFKVFLWLKAYNLLRDILSSSFDLAVAVERNFERGVPWFSFTLNFGQQGASAQGWGYFPWGASSWGSPQSESIKSKLKSGKAQAIRYVMTNSTLHEKIAISAWETLVTAPYSTDLKD